MMETSTKEEDSVRERAFTMKGNRKKMEVCEEWRGFNAMGARSRNMHSDGGFLMWIMYNGFEVRNMSNAIDGP